MLLTSRTALFAAFPSLSSFFAGVLPLLRHSVSVLKFEELDQPSDWLCRSCRAAQALPRICSEIPSGCLWLKVLGAKALRCRLRAAVVCGDSSFFGFFPLIPPPCSTVWEILHLAVQSVLSVPTYLPLQPIPVPWLVIIRLFGSRCSSKQPVWYFISHKCMPSPCHLEN